MCLSKKFLFLASCIFILITLQSAKAEKLTITKFDNYLNMSGNFYDEDGNKIFLDEYEGETILLVFWATWCGNCINDLTSLDNLQKDFRKLPFKVIALSEDFQNIDIVKKHFDRMQIRHLKIFHDRQNQIFRAFDIVGLPTSYLINSSGKLKLAFKGSVKWHDNEIRKMILKEIDGNHELPKNTYKVKNIVEKNEFNNDSKIEIKNEKTEDKSSKNEPNKNEQIEDAQQPKE
ncbi:MAG: TlpA family protein disulfide reductase [Rickettsiales bacterium]|nr:MAG: TlpA family protein disulfide reductase [Rickettsiales bacterium]